MKNKKFLIILLILILPVFSMVMKVSPIQGVVEKNIPKNDNSISSVPVGDLAPDFSIMDVSTHENYTLYDFLGKMVFLDLFATWCGPCEISLPYIRLFYDMYPEDMLQIISIDVDNNETENQVSGFRNSHDMDWIVGIDVDGSIDSAYGSGFIPTFYLLNTTGHVIWYGVGIDEATFFDTLYGYISQYLPDDTQKPQILDFYVENKTTELSIFEPSYHIFANVSENRKLQSVIATITTSSGSENIELKFNKIGAYYIVDQFLTFKPEDLYSETSVSINVKFTDFWNLADISDTAALYVTHYSDSGPPTIGSVGITVNTIDETKFNVTVFAEISEDLMLIKADVRLMKGEKVVKAWSFEEYNTTHMVASGLVLNSLAEPSELKALIILEDVAGNTVQEEFVVQEGEGTTTKTEANFVFVILALASLFGVVSLRRR
ncbi:MAG: TlpA family protein disulfide reductase [Candidatus Heimdallarchaeaceae archaeon]